MFAELLVSLDESPRALGVFSTATAIARAFGSRLHLFRAPDVPPEFPAAGAGSQPDLLGDYLSRAAIAELDAFARRAPDLVFGPPVVRVGRPWKLILEVADEVNADLILIGSHGFGGVDRLIGTTAARVANRAKRSVFVVHDTPGGVRLARSDTA